MDRKNIVIRSAAGIMFFAAAFWYVIMPGKADNIKTFSVTGKAAAGQDDLHIKEPDAVSKSAGEDALKGSVMIDTDNGRADTSAGMTGRNVGVSDTNTGMTGKNVSVADTNTGMADMSAGMTDTSAGMTDASVAKPGTGAGVADKNSGRININTAGAEELTLLPGIGMARAQAIISYRNINGPFESIEELMNVSGIKEGIFSKVRDRICCE